MAVLYVAGGSTTIGTLVGLIIAPPTWAKNSTSKILSERLAKEVLEVEKELGQEDKESVLVVISKEG